MASIAEKILDEVQLNPRLLGIEATETEALRELDAVAKTLGYLSEMGIHLAIDDFGTGYSSLRYLQRLPFDELKIDYSFTQGIDKDANSRNIVAAIVALSKALDLTVLAEGVETEQQLDFLCELGCDGFQGWLFSRAVPVDEFEKILKDPSKVVHSNWSSKMTG